MVLSQALKKDIAGLVLVSFLGALVSVLPHLIWYWKSGSPLWISDYDELGLYLAVSSQSYFNHVFWFSDPAIISSSPTSFPWLQMFPGHFLNWALGYSPTNVLLIWRVFAGVSIGAGWFLLFRQLVSSRWLAIGAAIWLLFDGGILHAQPLIRCILNLLSAGWNDNSPLFAGKPILLQQWRLITPGLSWFYLSLFLVAMAFLQKNLSSKKLWVWAGIAFGLQFYSYFFFWTTCGLGLVLAILLDRPRATVYLKVGSLGLLLGLPALIKDSLLKAHFSDDWLLRADRFLPIDRFSELMFPKTGFALALITFFVIRYRHRDLTWMWCQAAAGLILLNHQIVTGLQIENFHWNYAWAPILTVLVFVLSVRELEKKNWMQNRTAFLILISVLSLHVVSGFWLRSREATKSLHTLELRKYFEDYQIQKSSHAALQFDPSSSLAGENWYINYAMSLENVRPLVTYTTIFSPAVDDNELYERMALNAILRGKNFETYRLDQTRELDETVWGPWQRNLAIRHETLKQRLEIFNKVQSDVPAFIKKFKVQSLALFVKETPPQTLRLTLLQPGPIWNVWKIE